MTPADLALGEHGSNERKSECNQLCDCCEDLVSLVNLCEKFQPSPALSSLQNSGVISRSRCVGQATPNLIGSSRRAQWYHGGRAVNLRERAWVAGVVI